MPLVWEWGCTRLNGTSVTNHTFCSQTHVVEEENQSLLLWTDRTRNTEQHKVRESELQLLCHMGPYERPQNPFCKIKHKNRLPLLSLHPEWEGAFFSQTSQSNCSYISTDTWEAFCLASFVLPSSSKWMCCKVFHPQHSPALWDGNPTSGS